MTNSTVEITVPDGAYRALIAGSQTHPDRPAILMLPETYNLNSWVRLAAQRYAERGYLVLTPDLLWRQEPGLDLQYTPEDQQRGRALVARLDREQAVADLRAAVDWLRHTQGIAKVASIGYCLGGELTFLMAAAGLLDAGSAYYPIRMQHHLQLVPKVQVPLLIHVGALDHHTPPDLVEDLRTAVAGHPSIRLDVHAEANHGFGRFGHPQHHAPSAEQAEGKTFDLLKALEEG